MIIDISTLAVASPLHSVDRDRLQALRPGVPLGPIYANSSALPCTMCQMTLAVGPRITAIVNNGEATLLCPLCASQVARIIAAARGEPVDIDVVSMGNPEFTKK